jgi:hypothetical protein
MNKVAHSSCRYLPVVPVRVRGTGSIRQKRITSTTSHVLQVVVLVLVPVQRNATKNLQGFVVLQLPVVEYYQVVVPIVKHVSKTE